MAYVIILLPNVVHRWKYSDLVLKKKKKKKKKKKEKWVIFNDTSFLAKFSNQNSGIRFWNLQKSFKSLFWSPQEEW